jgi:mycothiol system anti-sigma-R factor
MNPCDEFSARALRYIDNTLQGQDLTAFRAHLQTCGDCRALIEAEQGLSQLLRRTRPLYSAPPALRARVAVILEEHRTRARAREGFSRRVVRLLEGKLAPRFPIPRLGVVVPAVLVVALILAFVPSVARQVRAANYVETAVAMHRGYLNGSVPLQVLSNSPEQVAAWFTGKLEFPFLLPKAQITPQSVPAYQLTGASLVHYQGNSAALVAYQKQNEKISLLVASNDSATIAGGYEVRSGALVFHYRTEGGFKVITWSNHGLSYALVSSVSGSARESCMVCHQSMADRQSFSISSQR